MGFEETANVLCRKHDNCSKVSRFRRGRAAAFPSPPCMQPTWLPPQFDVLQGQRGSVPDEKPHSGALVALRPVWLQAAKSTKGFI